jgi:putative ABC transport system permease protein
VVRAIYTGRDGKTDESQFFFHWSYLNESLRRTAPRRADSTGIYFVGIDDADRAAEISAAIDSAFRNSLAETLTETEKAFQLGFVSMSEAIVAAIRIVALLVVVIIMAVTANTMAMAARERLAEYATLKALGFRPSFLRRLIAGESLLIALAGGGIGIAVTFPVTAAFGPQLGTLFPVFQVSPQTIALQLGAALVIGLVAAVAPSIRASRVRIAEGLRAVG